MLKKKIKSKDIFIVFYVVFVFADLPLFIYTVKMVKIVDFKDAACALLKSTLSTISKVLSCKNDY